MNKIESNQKTRKFWQSLEEKQDLSLSDWNRPEDKASAKEMTREMADGPASGSQKRQTNPNRDHEHET